MLRLSAPLDCQIELTDKCHQRCVHCYNLARSDDGHRQGCFLNLGAGCTQRCVHNDEIHRVYPHPRTEELTIEEMLTVLDRLAGLGVTDANLTGGEPLLRPDLVCAMLRRSKELGMNCAMNTTAYQVDDIMANDLAASGLQSALVTLLGIGEMHDRVANCPGGFERSCEGIRALARAGIKVHINMVVSTLNQSDIAPVGRLAKTLGASTFSATPAAASNSQNVAIILSPDEYKRMLRTILETSRELSLQPATLLPVPRCMLDPDEDSELAPFLGKRLCSAGITSCVISATGGIRPCPQSDIEYGNILVEDFATIWQRMECWTLPEMLPEDCRGCTANVVCEGGCRMRARFSTGSYAGADPYKREPIRDSQRVFPDHKHAPYEFPNGPFVFNQRLRLRTEPFGAVLCVDENVQFLTADGLRIVTALRELSSFTIEQAAAATDSTPEQIQPVLQRLANQQAILTRTDKGGGENADQGA